MGEAVVERTFDGPERPGFWLSHLRAGVILALCACVLGFVEILVVPSMTHRFAAAMILVGVMVATLGLLVLPLPRLIGSRRSAAILFSTWSGGCTATITVGLLLTGGTRSPFVLFYFLTIVFGATAYPPVAVRVLGVATIACYLMVAAVAGHGAGPIVITAGSLALTDWICGIAAGNHWDQLQEQERLARTDGLTGCLTYRAFRERLDLEVRRADRLAVIVADVDDFKRLNDTHGHLAGDEALAGIGAVLLGHVRAVDAVGRIGGDEFAVVLPGASAAEASDIAERVRAATRDLPRAIPMTISVGVASSQVGHTAAQLLDSADRALYAGKRQRRIGLGRPAEPVLPVLSAEPVLPAEPVLGLVRSPDPVIAQKSS